MLGGAGSRRGRGRGILGAMLRRCFDGAMARGICWIRMGGRIGAGRWKGGLICRLWRCRFIGRRGGRWCGFAVRGFRWIASSPDTGGYTPPMIADSYPSVPLADIFLLISYYLRNKDSVHAYLGEREERAHEISARAFADGLMSQESWQAWCDDRAERLRWAGGQC